MIKKSLQAIISEVALIEHTLLETSGEITPEIEKLLEVKELQLPEKIDACANIVERFEMIEELYKKKAQDLLKIAKASAAISERIKENIKEGMKVLKTNHVYGIDYRYTLSPSKPSVVVEDESKIDGCYKVTEVITKIDKNKIVEDLKLGVPVLGAKLQENFSLRKYLNRGDNE